MSKCEKCAKYPCKYILTFDMNEDIGCIEFQEKIKGEEIMNKSLEAIERLKIYLLISENGFPYNAYNQSKTAIKEDLEIIEKELKAIEIIRNKKQRIGNCIIINIASLNETEYSNIMEVLGND